ncbi:MAG: BON domain-containing protein [Planctomycetes bacterium]|nr:BON domain-containing protein [Planctomycetota bacterium]
MEATTLAVSALSEQVAGILGSSPYICRRQVQIEATDGNVRLEGTVSSFFQKQMAQEIVRRVDGVRSVENQLQVTWR